jgi:2-polyprenyl-3-methyl-5-hydroxy-6-metoxy-1,4-benzoquinol methylase
VAEAAPPAVSVWSLIDGFVGWSATVAALELGLFGILADRPAGGAPADLAASCGAPADRVETLCRALAGLGLLESEEGRYRLAPSADALRPGSPGYLGDLLVLSPGRAVNWLGLVEVLRGADPAAPVDDDLEGFHAPLARATFGLQRATAARLPTALGLDVSRPLRVADVGAGGAGGGAWSVGLLEALPHASAVLIDRPALLAAARDHAGAAGVASRCTFVESALEPAALDALVDRGEAGFDLVVLAHALRHLPPSDAGSVVAAAARALGPEGVIAVAAYIVDGEATTGRAATLDLVTLANTRAWHLVTPSRLDGWLTAAGLGQAEDLGISPVFSVVAARAS